MAVQLSIDRSPCTYSARHTATSNSCSSILPRLLIAGSASGSLLLSWFRRLSRLSGLVQRNSYPHRPKGNVNCLKIELETKVRELKFNVIEGRGDVVIIYK